jgi:aspartate aminotransferase-like enzyme
MLGIYNFINNEEEMYKLFYPGPTNVSEDVLEKMDTPMISHR